MKLTIKGKEYGMHFGIGASEMAAEVFGQDPNDIFFNSLMVDKDLKPISPSTEIVFGAIINWCEENGETVDFTYTNFRNAYNDLSLDKRGELLKLYQSSMHNGRVVSEIFEEILATYEQANKKEEEPKKKVTRTKKSSGTSSNGADMTIVE